MRSIGLTARLRIAIHQRPRTTRELAEMIGREPNHVWGLLRKADWCAHADGQWRWVDPLPRAIAAARELLERHGYRVELTTGAGR